MSMNSRPPRATADRNVDTVPKVKARMRKSCIWNIVVVDPSLDGRERRETDDPGRQERDHARAAPSGRVCSVRAYPVG